MIFEPQDLIQLDKNIRECGNSAHLDLKIHTWLLSFIWLVCVDNDLSCTSIPEKILATLRHIDYNYHIDVSWKIWAINNKFVTISKDEFLHIIGDMILEIESKIQTEYITSQIYPIMINTLKNIQKQQHITVFRLVPLAPNYTPLTQLGFYQQFMIITDKNAYYLGHNRES